MENKSLKFMVEYVDDFNKKHITILDKLSDVKFYQDRFYNKVKYEPIEFKQEYAETGYIGTFIS